MVHVVSTGGDMNIAVFVKGFATIFWVIVVGAVVFMVVQASRGRTVKRGGVIIGVLVAVAILLGTISAGLVFINPQERGVVISALSPSGYRQQALNPGIHWIVPFAESVVVYPISRQTYTMSIASYEGDIQGDDSIAARTADGQEIFVDASVIYAVNPENVVQVHIEWQDRYGDELVRPQSRGIIRDAVSQFGVEEVYSSKRLDLIQMVTEAMTQKLADNGLILVDFVLRNITFSPEYAASVEQKQIAEQQAQQAKFIVEQRKQEAEQARQVAQGTADAAVIRAKGDAEARIIAAEAEAKALDLLAQALKDKPELLTYQYINKLSPNVSVMFLPSDSPFLFPLPDAVTGVNQ
jgi:regulator of protease activity HflC (stomatin/prohibitin superfamily)